MRWPFRKARPQPRHLSVRIEEVSRCKPDQLRKKVGLPHTKEPTILVAGNFTDIGLDGVDSLKVPITRRFSSVAGMFQAALGTVEWRQRAYRAGEGPPTLFLLMSEHEFRDQKSEKRFRYIVDQAPTCHFAIVVVCSWLRPLEETW